MNATGERTTYTPSLWVALLLSPVAWAVQMSARYAMQPWLCTHASAVPADIVAVLALAVALAAAWLGHARLRALRARSDTPSQPEAKPANASWLRLQRGSARCSRW
jgi:hypothetical protein